MEFIETIIIGGGQAGLATSYYLSQDNHQHQIFEQASAAANAWRNERWDSFTLVTPNWTLRLPGAKINPDERDGYLPRTRLVEFFENYIEEFHLPVKYNTRVTSVEFTDNYYLVHANENIYKSKNVVVAVGLFKHPRFPSYASGFPDNILQLHSSSYKNPESVPSGGVLIIGSGQSGCQIAEELHNAGLKVFLSTGNAGRVPRRYRGKDIVEWMEKIGSFNITPEQFQGGRGRFDANPHVSGTKGGHNINLHLLAKNGIQLMGHFKGAENQKIFFSPDLYNNLSKADQFEMNLLKMIDTFILENGVDLPQEEIPVFNNGYLLPVIEELDLKSESINSVIWACGYAFDFSFIKLPVFDSSGFPLQKRGKTEFPGLYFVGLPWMPDQKSGLLIGMAECANYIASDILKTEKDIMNTIVST